MPKMVRGLVNKLISPPPSFFDLLVCIYLLLIAFNPNTYETRLTFNLGVIFMISMSMAMKPLREYNSLPLFLILAWTFIGIFLHSYRVYDPESVIYKFMNVSLLTEGFIYVFSGAFLLYLVVRFCRRIWPVILTLAVCSIPYWKSAYNHGKMTATVAFLLALMIYALMNKRWLWAKISLACMGVGAGAIWLKWFLTVQQEAKNVIYFKFACRPYIWIQLFKDLKEHWIVGTGFPHYLGTANMFWVDKIGEVTQGWLFRHNDYLGLGVYLGVPVMLLIAWFLIDSFRKIWDKPSAIIFLTLAIIPIFQCTMFDVYRASLMLTTGALCIRSGYER